MEKFKAILADLERAERAQYRSDPERAEIVGVIHAQALREILRHLAAQEAGQRTQQ